MTDKFWTESMVERLRELAAQGLSASGIAEAIGGVSRNAIIGVLARKGIPLTGRGTIKSRVGRMVQTKARAQRRAPYSPKFEPPEAVIEALPEPSRDDAAIPVDQLKALVDLEAGDCRWPITMPSGEHRFCPARAIDGAPYCASHQRRASNSGAYRSALRPYVPARTAR